MTRDEWNQVLATDPATPNQRGAVMRECDRLGLVDRAERLAVLAALLGLDELDSTADLTMGEAGKLINILEHTRDRAELLEVAAAAAADMDQADAVARVSLAEAIGSVIAALMLALERVQGDGLACLEVSGMEPET